MYVYNFGNQKSTRMEKSSKIAFGPWFVMNLPENQHVYLTLSCLYIESRSHV